MPRSRLIALLVIAALVAAALVVVDREVERKALERAALEKPGPETLTRIDSVLHNMETHWVSAPEDPGAGGALATLGDTLILAARSGQFLQMRADESGFDPLDIAAPFALDRQVEMFDSRINRFSLGTRGALIRQRDGQIDLYVSHTHGYPDQNCITVAVSRTALRRGEGGLLAQVGNWSQVFNASPCLAARHDQIIVLQAGGPMALHPDGGVLFQVGDFSIDTVFRHRDTIYPQDPEVSYGKVWHLDPDTDAPRLYSLGHRNASGITVTPQGRVWMVEHGPKGGDELNLIEEGANYGWPLATYGVKYGTPDWPPALDRKFASASKGPIFSWLPSIAVSGVIEVHGAEFPRWQGDILTGALAGQKLVRLRMAEGPRVAYQEDIPLGHRIRAIAQLPSGRIALKLDWQPFVLLLSAAEETAGEIPAALEICAGCHALTADGYAGSGPTLANVLERKIGTVTGYAYSEALKSVDGQWEAKTLSAFLLDPASVAPGTKMANLGLSEAEVAEVLAALSDLAEEKLD